MRLCLLMMTRVLRSLLLSLTRNGGSEPVTLIRSICSKPRLRRRKRAGAREYTAIETKRNLLARRMYERGRKLLAGWEWREGDKVALLFGRDTLLAHLAQESFRISAVPARGGGLDTGNAFAGWQLSGSRVLNLTLIGLPERIPSLESKFQDIAQDASDIMRGRGMAGPQPSGNGAAIEHTPAQTRLATLLKRQSELATLAQPTPEQDQEYAAVVAEIAKASAAAEAMKEANHG
jgi:hypothetical protein